MGEVAARQFDCLMLNGKNYQTWVVDCQFHLAAMQLTHTITPRADGAPAIPAHEIAKASIFLRHHIRKDLKQEYLEVRDSLKLWLALEERFGKQRTVVLPQARRDWSQLRFLDSALHRIVGQLRFGGQRVTDAEMIEKTLETFHPSNMVLQQQYRNNRYRKYSELINVLLAAETQNELLMKNFNMRPVGSNALPEAHASFHKKNKTFYKKGMYSQKPRGQGKCKAQNGQKGDANTSEHPNKGCFRCGSMNHWSRQCRTEPHLIQMYQDWKKRQNPEAHFVQAPVDAVTGEHVAVLPQSVQKIDDTSTAMDDGDIDCNLDEEDTLDDDYGDME
ncbi:hypothetical protein PVAP13_7KG122361 [Panicum virgatum]|uniref:CCHC-type domain-containing protein n=1 Tax=Panicum virgatum TaxID=38727 RepID=A0A8T0QDH8_PANVG|nr:hypothetical protein PVAP13_7KG122361 [Panicum virgatum]